MTTTFPVTRTENSSDRLGFSLFLAVAAHVLIIFGLGFKLIQPSPTPTSLEITLAQYQSKSPDEEVDFLAQFNQKGSGDQQKPQELTNSQPAIIEDNQMQQLMSSPPQQEQEVSLSSETVLTTQSASETANTLTEQIEQKTNRPSASLSPSRIEQINSLKALLDEQQHAYSRMPKVRYVTTVSTRAADEAAYLSYWTKHVEMVGNQNYPQEARRRKIYGDLRLAVILLPDGRIDNVEILQSSGQRVLDQAAIRIVRMASPFKPLSADILKQQDMLGIIRTWRFEKGHTLQTGS